MQLLEPKLASRPLSCLIASEPHYISLVVYEVSLELALSEIIGLFRSPANGRVISGSKSVPLVTSNSREPPLLIFVLFRYSCPAVYLDTPKKIKNTRKSQTPCDKAKWPTYAFTTVKKTSLTCPSRIFLYHLRLRNPDAFSSLCSQTELFSSVSPSLFPKHTLLILAMFSSSFAFDW